MEWAKAVPQKVKQGLSRSLIKRDQMSMLVLNFDPELLAVLKEVNYLKQVSYEDIPQEALNVRIFYEINLLFVLSIHESYSLSHR